MQMWTVIEGRLADGLPMRMYLAEKDGALWRASLQDDEHPLTEDSFEWRLGNGESWNRCQPSYAPEVLCQGVTQVSEYFRGARTTFDLPLSLRGTDFQVRVWQQLGRIPFGEVCTYGDIAEQIDKPSACRAVGNANGRNNLPLVIPCHRVIAAGGKLGGFTGGLGLKKRLLAHEAQVVGWPNCRLVSARWRDARMSSASPH